MNYSYIFVPFVFVASALSSFVYADVSPSEYKTNKGGDWTSSDTWNMLNPTSSYPNSNAHAFCVEGTGKTLTLNTDVTVGRMIGGGGHFDNCAIEGTGSIVFDVLYDSKSSYNYAASSLWGHGSITYKNEGGVAFTTSDTKTTGWSETEGIKILNTKAGTTGVSQVINFDTSVLAEEVTSAWGKTSTDSVLNFNKQTTLTNHYVNLATTNFNGDATFGIAAANTGGVININGTAAFTTLTANSGGTVNVTGSITQGNISGVGNINFTGDYTKGDGKSITMGNIETKSSAIVNFNHIGQITTGCHYYENSGKVTVSDASIIKIDQNATANDSWGVKYLIQTGGTSVMTINGTIDALNYSGNTGTSSTAQLIRNWGNLVINSTAVIKASGKVSTNIYNGRASSFTINGNAVISGIKVFEMNQTIKNNSKAYINNSNTLANIDLIAAKDTGANDGTTADTLTNCDIFLTGNVNIGSFGFYQNNDQFTIDLTDCTSLVLHTLFNDSNANSKGGKLVFSNFKDNVVYIENVSGINMETLSDYVMTDVDGVELTIKNNYLVSNAIPEPAAFAGVFGLFSILLIALRSKKSILLRNFRLI